MSSRCPSVAASRMFAEFVTVPVSRPWLDTIGSS